MSRPNKLKGGLNAVVVIAATVAIVVLVNVLSGELFGRLDLSAHGVNTLSEVSKDAVRSLEDLEVRVYVAPDLPETIRDPQSGQKLVLRSIEQAFRDKLEEYHSYSDGNMKLVWVTDDVVKKAEAAKLAIFEGTEATTTEGGRIEFKKYVLGATFHYANVMEVFPLALHPEHYEYEISKILLRLAEKAEKSLTMKDALTVGERIDGAVTACAEALAAAAPEEQAPTNPFGLMTSEQSRAKVVAYKAAVPTLKQACDPVGEAVQSAAPLAGRHRPLDDLVALGNAFVQIRDQLFGALAAEDEQQQGGALQAVAQLEAVAKAVDDEHTALVDSPGKKRIGFVCAGAAFCPFPADKPLVPQELRGMLGQKNFMAEQVITQLERMEQRINQTLANVERGLFRGRGFDIAQVDLHEDIPSDVAALVLLGPKEALSEWELYAIDQFVLRGGSLVVFLNAWDVSLYNIDAKKEEMTHNALVQNSSNIGTLLASWGVTPNHDLILEPEKHDNVSVTSLVRQGPMTWQTRKQFAYPMLPKFDRFDDSSPLVRAVASMTLPYTSSLTLAGSGELPDGRTITPLVMSSEQAVSATDPSFPVVPTEQLARVAQQNGGTALVAAAAVTGRLSSHFAGKEAPAAPKKETPEGEQPDPSADLTKPKKLDEGQGRVLVIGSNLGLEDLSITTIAKGFNMGLLTEQNFGIIDQFKQWSANLQNWDVRLTQIQHTLADSLQFVFNALDWAVQKDAIVEIRSKQYQRRPLDQTDASKQAWIRAFAIGGGPVVFIALGAVLWGIRRSRKRKLGELVG